MDSHIFQAVLVRSIFTLLSSVVHSPDWGDVVEDLTSLEEETEVHIFLTSMLVRLHIVNITTI